MDNNDFDKFATALEAALDVYGKPISPMVTNIWWEALKKYDLGAVMNGFSKHIQNTDNGQFAPKPADIIKFIEGSTHDRALQAWSKVNKAIRSIGTYQSVVFDDPIIHQTIRDMGGWIGLGQKTDDDWPFVAKEFENRYRGHLASDNTDYPSKLIGISEAANTETGQKVAPPILIGNKEKAEQIFIGGGENKLIETSPLSTLKLKSIA